MADAASGLADKSVQVKLVLLGKPPFPCTPQHTCHPDPPSLLSRLLMGPITQAKLPWANPLSFFASYVASIPDPPLLLPLITVNIGLQ